MLSKLLKQNISKPQLIGFSAANLIGLAIILLSVQLFVDINPLFKQKDTIFKRDFFIISKNITILNTINKVDGFTGAEIDEIKKQDFVKSAGCFTSSQFEVYGGISTSGMSIGTDLFFESVPTQFIDIQSDNWEFNKQENFIPIIIPQNYLDLYNFGFAASRQMPNISSGTAQMVKFNLTIGGNGKMENFTGGIVGFSNRINTILVPEEFMKWANAEFSSKKPQNPARLIVEISNITDPKITSFFKSHNYNIEGENQAVSRMSFFLGIIISIAVIIGLIICVLSFIILILSIYLIIQKDREKIKNLRLIGYSKNQISFFYFRLITVINLVVLSLAFLTVFCVRPIYCKTLTKIFDTFTPNTLIYTILTGIIFFSLITLLNFVIVRRKVD